MRTISDFTKTTLNGGFRKRSNIKAKLFAPEREARSRRTDAGLGLDPLAFERRAAVGERLLAAAAVCSAEEVLT